ncbi:hypothetical protein GCM10018781_77730 [Kitasatospora indigofera]|uniref:Uncharacterized protein n=1 Tax=Kitasatospora indigofera TaxID=67307 RepID=A0A919DAB9_9ACTN|nr:hypothetical protein GCM10018781_77730 [Kitasatospora indigofera]
MLSTCGSAAISGASRWLEAVLTPAPEPRIALLARARLMAVRIAAVRAGELDRAGRRVTIMRVGSRFRDEWCPPRAEGGGGARIRLGSRTRHCGPDPATFS